MTEYVRVRPASQGGPCAVWVPELGAHIVPNPAQAYSTDDPVVKAARWMFVADDELTEEKPVTEVPIECATRAPGERRHTRRGQ